MPRNSGCRPARANTVPFAASSAAVNACWRVFSPSFTIQLGPHLLHEHLRMAKRLATLPAFAPPIPSHTTSSADSLGSRTSIW